MNAYISKFNLIKRDPEQYIAFSTNKSAVVIAGPGSGKTTVLTMKVMRLLRDRINKPRGLACITFSREAAREFKERLLRLGYQKQENVFLGTVHAFCIAEVISPFMHLYKYDMPLPIKLIPNNERKRVYRDVLKKLKVTSRDVSIEQMDKERNLSISGISKVEIPSYDIALKVAKEYEEIIHSLGFVDFVDIVKYSTLLIQEEEYVRKCLNAKFEWLLIDEYQDLGKPLHEMVLALFNKTNIKIFAVGDPDQSIYSFSGAIPDYLTELYRNTSFLGIRLKRNYRSNQGIINASVVGLSEKRHYVAATRIHEDAKFEFIVCNEEMNQQYEAVVNNIIPNCLENKISLGEICVIVGYNSEVKDLTSLMEEEKIPYYVSKHEFVRSDVVLWLEKCAKWVVDKNSESFNEIFKFWWLLQGLTASEYFYSDFIYRKIRIYDLLMNSKVYQNSLIDWLKYVIKELNLEDILKESELYPDEIDNLANLTNVASEGRFSSCDILKFSRLGKPENEVTVTTRHSSKGLEFEVVILLGMEEERFPDRRKIPIDRLLKEEHRIFFVCLSRAKSTCFLLRSRYHTLQTRFGPWKKEFQPSRFWNILIDKYGFREKIIKDMENR